MKMTRRKEKKKQMWRCVCCGHKNWDAARRCTWCNKKLPTTSRVTSIIMLLISLAALALALKLKLA